LGNQTKSRPNKTGNKGKGNTNRRRRRRPQSEEYPDDEGSLEVIPADQLEASKSVMNLTELNQSQKVSRKSPLRVDVRV
jgi:hypothetical protein